VTKAPLRSADVAVCPVTLVNSPPFGRHKLASLKSGGFADVVQRSSDAYCEMLRRDPELMKGPLGMRRIRFFPRLGARLIQEQGGSPAVIYDRETFSFSEAITYFEFAVDNLVREGL